MIFWKYEVAQNYGDFLFSQIISFLPIKQFKTWFVDGILRFLEWFDLDVLDFQIALCCR
jgi:hypothetical protein